MRIVKAEVRGSARWDTPPLPFSSLRHSPYACVRSERLSHGVTRVFGPSQLDGVIASYRRDPPFCYQPVESSRYCIDRPSPYSAKIYEPK